MQYDRTPGGWRLGKGGQFFWFPVWRQIKWPSAFSYVHYLSYGYLCVHGARFSFFVFTLTRRESDKGRNEVTPVHARSHKSGMTLPAAHAVQEVEDVVSHAACLVLRGWPFARPKELFFQMHPHCLWPQEMWPLRLKCKAVTYPVCVHLYMCVYVCMYASGCFNVCM